MTDGPYTESKEQPSGYYRIEVDDLDAALESGPAGFRSRSASSRSARSCWSRAPTEPPPRSATRLRRDSRCRARRSGRGRGDPRGA
nr:hypothetical protein [Gordonia polyisoprenivorans]